MKAKRLLPLVMAAVIGASALTGCGSIDKDATGATLNGKEISLGFMNFMARYQQAIYDGYGYASYFGTDYWSQDLYGTGSDMETTTKQQVAENIEVLYLLEEHMEDYGVEITEEELSKMDEAAEQFMSDNSKAAIEEIGASKEYVKEMLRLSTIQNKMAEAIYNEVDTEVSDEEAAQKTFSYVRVSKTTTTDADGNSVEYTEEQKEELKTNMEAYAQSAGEDFDGAAQEAGYTVSTYSFGADESSFSEAVISQADEMKDGEISGLLEDDDNYYVIRMDSTFDEEKTASKKESIIQERKTDHYTEVCDGYKESAEFEINESEWKKVKFEGVFTMKQEETDSTDSTDSTNSTGSTNSTDSTDNTGNTDSTENE